MNMMVMNGLLKNIEHGVDMNEFQRVELTFRATLMTNFGLDLDRDEILDALNDALDSVNDGNFLVGTTELVTKGEYDE
jgi:hypothetical protein